MHRCLFVWDLGWQAAVPGWGSGREPPEIRLLVHATDPQFVEPRLGRPASKGCIRIAAAMSRFLDLQGVLDADHERAAVTDKRIAYVLDTERTPTPLAGNTLIVIDTSPNVPVAPARNLNRFDVRALPGPRARGMSRAAPSTA